MSSADVAIQLEPVNCPLCRRDDTRKCVSGADYLCGVAGTFTVVRCGHCGHAFLNPRPDSASVPDCYPDSYGPFALARGSEPSETCSKERTKECTEGSTESAASVAGRQPWYLSRMVRLIPGVRRLYYWLIETHSIYFPVREGPGRRALDLGCSSGSLLLQLRDQGWDAQGVEIAASPARAAKELGFTVHVGTLESSNFEDGQFDVVFAMMVIEHVPDPVATLREIRRILIPGGLLVMSVPNFGCWERLVFGRFWRGLELPRHLQHFTRRSLRQLAQLTDFHVEQINDQYNLSNIIASLGLMLSHWFPQQPLGRNLIDYTDHPTLLGQLLLAIPSRLLAVIHQGGRLTIIFRRSDESTRV
jgi:2-polyprenyl-3-methyl-5-hydroxy-6-metoxy-1,4-benzoquinol methylase